MGKYLITLFTVALAAHPIFAQTLAESLQGGSGQFAEIHEDKNKNDRTNSKMFLVGLGEISFLYKAEIPAKKANVENLVKDLGISISIKSQENLVQFRNMSSGLGYFLSLNTFAGLSVINATTNKSSNPPIIVGNTKLTQSSSYILSPKKQSKINHITQNLSLGINFYFNNPIVTTHLGAGGAINFLFKNFEKLEKGFSLILGAGVAFELSFAFFVSPLLSIPIGIHVSYYPVNFDTFNPDIKYKTSAIVLSSVQLGVAFSY